MAIKCTVTTDLRAKDKKGFSGVQKHTEHDSNLNHKNKDIVFDETRFNVYYLGKKAVDNIDRWNESKFKDFVEEHDKHQREKGHPERQWGSVKEYLKSKNKATGVLTIGNMEVQSKLMEEFCPATSYHEEVLKDGTKHTVFTLKDENGKPISENINVAKMFYGCFNRALIEATGNNLGWPPDKVHSKRINVSEFLYRGRYATNNDELGISHIHYEIATYGMTRGGKKRGPRPTNSLNQALVSLHYAVTGKNCSGRDAIAWYRKTVDKYALKCLEKEFEKTYKVPAKTKVFEFERKMKEDKSLITGLSMEQLKSQKEEIAEHQRAIEDVDSKKKEAVSKLRKLYKDVTGNESKDNQGNDLSALDMSNGLTSYLGGLKKQVDDKEKEKEQAESDKKKADKEKQQAITAKKNAEADAQTARQQLIDFQNQQSFEKADFEKEKQDFEKQKSAFNAQQDELVYQIAMFPALQRYLDSGGQDFRITSPDRGKIFEMMKTDVNKQAEKAKKYDSLRVRYERLKKAFKLVYEKLYKKPLEHLEKSVERLLMPNKTTEKPKPKEFVKQASVNVKQKKEDFSDLLGESEESYTNKLINGLGLSNHKRKDPDDGSGSPAGDGLPPRERERVHSRHVDDDKLPGD